MHEPASWLQLFLANLATLGFSGYLVAKAAFRDLLTAMQAVDPGIMTRADYVAILAFLSSVVGLLLSGYKRYVEIRQPSALAKCEEMQRQLDDQKQAHVANKAEIDELREDNTQLRKDNIEISKSLQQVWLESAKASELFLRRIAYLTEPAPNVNITVHGPESPPGAEPSHG